MITSNKMSPSCTNHKCDHCKKKLYVGKWWHSAIVIGIVFGCYAVVIGLASWLQPSYDDNSPICYKEHSINNGYTYREFMNCPK